MALEVTPRPVGSQAKIDSVWVKTVDSKVSLDGKICRLHEGSLLAVFSEISLPPICTTVESAAALAQRTLSPETIKELFELWFCHLMISIIHLMFSKNKSALREKNNEQSSTDLAGDILTPQR